MASTPNVKCRYPVPGNGRRTYLCGWAGAVYVVRKIAAPFTTLYWHRCSAHKPLIDEGWTVSTVATQDASGRDLIYPGEDGTQWRSGRQLPSLAVLRDLIVAREIRLFERTLARKTLRPGARIAVGGARIAALNRQNGNCEGYHDNGFTVSGMPVCAMTGCHRTREEHGNAQDR